jgi:hypothetical protein
MAFMTRCCFSASGPHRDGDPQRPGPGRRLCINSVLAPPLIVLVVLLTSSRAVMGERVNPPLLSALGWLTAVIMAAATVGMLLA